MNSILTIPAQLVIDENNRRFAEVAAAAMCSGCHKAGCQVKPHRFPVDSSLHEGAIGVAIKTQDFTLLLANSLGLPLMGLLLGAGVGRFWDLHEGLQLGLAIVGLGIGMLSCRGYTQSMIRIRRREEGPCLS